MVGNLQSDLADKTGFCGEQALLQIVIASSG